MIRTLAQLYIGAFTVVVVIAGVITTMQIYHTPNPKATTPVAHAETKTVTDQAAKDEILWLARTIYSETKRHREQVLVGWVVRNRVDSERFADSYKAVARASGQFSGLQPFDSRYRHNITRGWESTGDEWKNALDVAQAIYYADPALRPFPKTMQYFYSPMSVSQVPKWARDRSPEHTITDAESGHVRFAFFSTVH